MAYGPRLYGVLTRLSLAVLPVVIAQPASAATDGRVAERVQFQRFTDADGLSQNTIFSMLQDRNGFMWFATFDGLNRFDGLDFTVFTHDALDPDSLIDSYVMSAV